MRTAHKRTLVGALIALIGVSAAAAAATTLGGIKPPPALGTGAATVAGCDPDSFNIDYTVSASDTVTAVVVSEIDDPVCDDAEIEVTLTDTGDVDIGSGGPVSVPSDPDLLDNTVTLTIAAAPDVADVANVHLVESGP